MKRLTTAEAEVLMDEVQAIIVAKCGEVTPYFLWIAGEGNIDCTGSNIEPQALSEELHALADDHERAAPSEFKNLDGAKH